MATVTMMKMMNKPSIYFFCKRNVRSAADRRAPISLKMKNFISEKTQNAILGPIIFQTVQLGSS